MTLLSPPPMSAFAASMYGWLEPVAVADDENGYPLAILCGGLGAMYADVEDLVRAQPGRDAWQQAFDVQTTPDWNLPWLGQFNGTRGLQGLSALAQRTKIVQEPGAYRGTIGTLTAAIAATLQPVGGPARVIVHERTPDAWSIDVITDPAQTPDLTLTQQAAKTATVAGLVITVGARSVPIVDDGTRTVDAAIATVDAALFADVT